jgi:hypothetical protein
MCVLAWTCFVSLAVLIVSFVLDAFGVGVTPFGKGSTRYVISQRMTPTTLRQYDPAAQKFIKHDYSISFDIDVTTDYVGVVKSGRVDLTLAKGSSRSHARIDPLDLSYATDRGLRGTFDDAAALRMLEAIGLDGESERVQFEAGQLVLVTQNIKPKPAHFAQIAYDHEHPTFGSLGVSGGTSSARRREARSDRPRVRRCFLGLGRDLSAPAAEAHPRA